MIFLEAGHKLIQQVLIKQFDASTREESVNVYGSDYDGTTRFVIQSSDSGNKNILNLSFYVHGEQVFNQYGGIDLVRKTLPGLEVKSPGLVAESPIDYKNHTFTITIDVEKEEHNRDKWLKELPRIKTTFMSAVFLQAMEQHLNGGEQEFEPIKVPYRPHENIYIISDKGKSSSLVVVYSLLFRDAENVVFVNDYLRAFRDAKKEEDHTLNAAPNMNFSLGQLPDELLDIKSGVTEPKNEDQLKKEGWGFVSIELLDNHLTADKQMNTAELLIGFRSYLQYHLKCMKAQIHIHMREYVVKLMMNLNATKKNLSQKMTQQHQKHYNQQIQRKEEEFTKKLEKQIEDLEKSVIEHQGIIENQKLSIENQKLVESKLLEQPAITTNEQKQQEEKQQTEISSTSTTIVKPVDDSSVDSGGVVFSKISLVLVFVLFAILIAALRI